MELLKKPGYYIFVLKPQKQRFPQKIKYFCAFVVSQLNLKKSQALKYFRLLFILAIATATLNGCKKSKDTFTSRTYHGMVSRYNPLFNGQQALKSGERALSNLHVDKYHEILRPFKTGEKENVASIKPDMDRAIEKGAKVIRDHSMLIKGKQRNKFVPESYLLIGQSRFYKFEYLEALETFNYIIQQNPKSEIGLVAELWAARTETSLGNYISAKEKFENIYRNELLPKKLKGDAFAAYADLELDQKRYTPAYQLLSQAIERTKDKQKKIRWTFIMAQLQAQIGNNHKASELFLEVIKKGPPYELLFQAQLARARSFDVKVQHPSIVFKDLNKMLEDEKNADNLDQVYYVMAEVADKLDDAENVIKYLKKSVRSNVNNQRQIALSYLWLAELNFESKVYPLAAAYYDSTFSNIKEGNPRYKEIKIKKESLGELVIHINTITEQDSLLALAALPMGEREEKVDALIALKKQKEEEKREKEENIEFNNFNTGGGDGVGNAQASIEGGQWYFYNINLRSSGLRDFNIKYGNRKLEDNWRRKDKELVANFDEGEQAEDTTEVTEGGEDATDQQNEERKKYLSAIPTTKEAKEGSHQKIKNALLELANIYKNSFQDYDASETELLDFLKRYPDYPLKARVWYSLYRLNVLAQDEKDANHYKNLILKNYPDTEYAALLLGKPLKETDAKIAERYYAKTYEAYSNKEYNRSMEMADSAIANFGSTKQSAQFMLLKALSQGKLAERTKMLETLGIIVGKYGDTEQGKRAQSIIQMLTAPKPSASDDSTNLAADNGAEVAKTKYKDQPKQLFKYILVVPNTKVLVNDVTIQMSDFCKSYFQNIALTTKQVYISPEEQMVMVNGLPNQQKAMQFMDVLNQQKLLEQLFKGEPIKHFVISNSNFQKFYQDKDFEGYLKYFNENLKNN